MRTVTLLLVLTCIMMSSAFAASETGYDAFMKSREIVTTLYFDSNSDGLNNDEKSRLEAVITELRALQNSGRMIRVEGFSSAEGDQEKNFHLSFFRARTVVEMITAEGLPAEVMLTGYGDLRATTKDPEKERRVEIASYLKPVGSRKVEIARERKHEPRPKPEATPVTVTPVRTEIDSYRLDQAIRSKVEDKQKGLTDKRDLPAPGKPGLSQKPTEKAAPDLERDYTHWRKSVDPDYSPKVSERAPAVESTPRRRYSQLDINDKHDTAPGLGHIMPVEAPIIDALMIEEAIRAKIAADEPDATDAVTQVNPDY